MAEINPNAVYAAKLNSPVSHETSASAAKADESDYFANFWGEDGFSFGDILDLINPFQQLPIIGTLYRAATGDEISAGSSILGGGLFGGLIGAGTAVVNSIIEQATGSEIGEHIMALFDGEDTPGSDDAGPTVLANSAIYGGFDAYQGRRAQEATGLEVASRMAQDPTRTGTPNAPVLASAGPADPLNPALGRRALEADMITAPPVRATASVLAAGPKTVIQAMATPVAQNAPLGNIDANYGGNFGAGNLTPFETPAWLSATPRAESGFAATAVRYMKPDAGVQVMQAVGATPVSAAVPETATPGSGGVLRDAIEHYTHRANAAKTVTTEPGILDSLF